MNAFRVNEVSHNRSTMIMTDYFVVDVTTAVSVANMIDVIMKELCL